MTTHAARYRTPDFIERERANALTLEIRDGAGAAATVATGTLTVKGDGVTIVDADPVGVGSSGEATYTIAALTLPDTLAYSIRWVEQWELVLDDGALVNIARDAHLVRNRPQPRWDAADLLRRHTDLGTQYTNAQLQVFCDDAFDSMIGRMLGDHRYPQEILSSWVLVEPGISLSLHYALADMSTYTAGAGKYSTLSSEYFDRFDALWGKVNWVLDRAQTGDNDGNSEASEPVVMLFDAPTYGGGY